MMASSVSSACLGSSLIKIQERIGYTSCQIELKKTTFCNISKYLLNTKQWFSIIPSE